MTTAVKKSETTGTVARVTLAQLRKAQAARQALDHKPASIPSAFLDDPILELDLVDDVAGRQSPAPPEQVDFSQAISRILGKRQRPIGPQPQSAVEYPSLDKLPSVFSLCKKVTITSPHEFTWLSSISASTEIEGLEAAAKGERSKDSATRIYSAITYWVCEKLSQEDWLMALRHAYFAFLYERCPYLFVEFKRYLVLFKRAGTEPVALISQSSKHFRDLLSSHGISSDSSEPHPDDIEEMEGSDIVKRKPAKTAISTLRISGKSVHSLYTFLANDWEDSRLLSPVPFLHGTLKVAQTSFIGEIQTEANMKSYRLILEGVILPCRLMEMMKVLEETQQGMFKADIERDSRSAKFGDIELTTVSLHSGCVEVTQECGSLRRF